MTFTRDERFGGKLFFELRTFHTSDPSLLSLEESEGLPGIAGEGGDAKSLTNTRWRATRHKASPKFLSFLLGAMTV
jgi:hypothetical protein